MFELAGMWRFCSWRLSSKSASPCSSTRGPGDAGEAVVRRVSSGLTRGVLHSLTGEPAVSDEWPVGDILPSCVSVPDALGPRGTLGVGVVAALVSDSLSASDTNAGGSPSLLLPGAGDPSWTAAVPMGEAWEFDLVGVPPPARIESSSPGEKMPAPKSGEAVVCDIGIGDSMLT